METRDHYEKKSRVKMDLNCWLAKDDRDDFSEWCQKQEFPERFGFSEKNIKKIFEEFFPNLKLVEGQPEKKKDD